MLVFNQQLELHTATQTIVVTLTLLLSQDGHPDRSFFSADCFHLSQKAHTQMARSLWNNMVAGKRTARTFQPISHCTQFVFVQNAFDDSNADMFGWLSFVPLSVCLFSWSLSETKRPCRILAPTCN